MFSVKMKLRFSSLCTWQQKIWCRSPSVHQSWGFALSDWSSDSFAETCCDWLTSWLVFDGQVRLVNFLFHTRNGKFISILMVSVSPAPSFHLLTDAGRRDHYDTDYLLVPAWNAENVLICFKINVDATSTWRCESARLQTGSEVSERAQIRRSTCTCVCPF